MIRGDERNCFDSTKRQKRNKCVELLGVEVSRMPLFSWLFDIPKCDCRNLFWSQFYFHIQVQVSLVHLLLFWHCNISNQLHDLELLELGDDFCTCCKEFLSIKVLIVQQKIHPTLTSGGNLHIFWTNKRKITIVPKVLCKKQRLIRSEFWKSAKKERVTFTI